MDLNQITNKNDLKKILKKSHPDRYRNYKGSLDTDAGTIWRFAKEIKIGDWVVLPDSMNDQFHVGKVVSHYYFQPDRTRKDDCDFPNRIKVKWLSHFTKADVKKVWGKLNIGNRTAVSRIIKASSMPINLVIARKAKAKPKKATKISWKPDAEWGKAAEKRAMEWLRSKGLKPIDVSAECKGWDIECDGIKYEVKGRHSRQYGIRLSQNEYEKAKKHKNNYYLLIFTAKTEAELKRANPKRIVDPAHSEDWRRKKIYEYFMEE